MRSHREIVDNMVLGSALELLGAWGTDAAPGYTSDVRPKEPLPELAASIDFCGGASAGKLHLCCPAQLQRVEASALVRRASPEDWIQELTNQLAGNLKRRLQQGQLTLGTGLPRVAHVVLLSKHLERADQKTFYELRTMRGSAIVVLEGRLDVSGLRYSGEPGPERPEGGVLLFGAYSDSIRLAGVR